ncbi:tyrosine-type recombinase/integrase [Micromonospora inyonensis]|uniref:Site-specific recombinase XerD n=1 Tax=Micromonospora inyonensis TaxID=47866 RepID=A0A1C6RDF2_9ACTN|nr:site-specific integrase [Micromonospora inyonensis]SCL15178.1 Site-specific recombinase XerD [Micromonospora inyonensis]
MARKPNGASSIYKGSDGSWHGRVTVGVQDDGKPDRRHVRGKTEAVVTKKVRQLERERDNGTVRKPGQRWTVKTWLTHWVENIAAPSVRENTIAGYRVAVYRHLVPGIGAHRLDRLEPEHLERFYVRMQEKGSAAATAHQAHRTIRTALNEAVRRGHLSRNPATLAKPPRLNDDEIEPYTVEEVRRLLAATRGRRNSARWAVALALGLRQGEALGLKWADVDLDAGALVVRRGRQRPRWRHGCTEPCGRKFGGHCPDRQPTRAETAETKSRAGRRTIGLPDELVELLRRHRREQEEERATAAQLWTDGGWLFATPTGEPVNPRTDYDEWKRLLNLAGLRDGRLHDARHTAATVLLILGVAERAVMGIMGWSNSAMATRYQHLTGQVRRDIAKRVGGLLWDGPTERDDQGDAPGRTEANGTGQNAN